jgi:hypothetical protein
MWKYYIICRCILYFLRKYPIGFEVVVQFCLPTSSVWVFSCSTALLTLAVLSFQCHYLCGCTLVSHCGFNFHLFAEKWHQHLFCASFPFIRLLLWEVFSSFLSTCEMGPWSLQERNAKYRQCDKCECDLYRTVVTVHFPSDFYACCSIMLGNVLVVEEDNPEVS